LFEQQPDQKKKKEAKKKWFIVAIMLATATDPPVPTLPNLDVCLTVRLA